MDLRELSWRERGWLWVRLGIRLLLTVSVLLLIFWAGPALLSLFMPFVVALILAWLINPLVRWLQRKLKISRKILSLLFILLVFGVVGGVLVAFVYAVGSEIYSLVENWSTVEQEISSALLTAGEYTKKLFALLPREMLSWLDNLYSGVIGWLQTAVPELLASVGARAGGVAMRLPSGVVAAVMFLMASYFITADYPAIMTGITRRLSPGTRNVLARVRKVAVGAFGGYVRAQLLLSLAVFFILLLGFAIIGQRYALLLALLLAVMDFIPIIGSGTVMVPWTVISLVTGDYRKALELIVIWGVICLFRRFAEPKVVGDQTGLSPILSLISIYVGMRLGGVLGMVLGPVLLLILMNLAKMDILVGTRRDLRLAFYDVRALLAAGRKSDC